MRVYDVGIGGPVHWIAMELVEGERTLQDVNQEVRDLGLRTVLIERAELLDDGAAFGSRASLRERHREVARFFAQLAEALSEMHSAKSSTATWSPPTCS